MASWNDVGTIAMALPEVTIGQAHEGSPAYDVAGRRELRELLVESWQARAPKRLAKGHTDLR